MKFLYIWLIISLGFLMPAYAQILIQWPLSPSDLGNATVVENDLTGISFERGNGLSALNFTGSGVSAKNWSTATIDEATVDFYEFGLAALPDKTIEIDELAFSERRSSSGPRTFSVYYSKDDFATQTLLETVNIPDNISIRRHYIPVGLKVRDGEALRFRLYAFNAEGGNGRWTLGMGSLQLSGISLPICSPPLMPASINITSIGTESIQAEISGGNGQARLIVIGPEQVDMPVPYQGTVYVGDEVYGNGSCLADKTHVVATTSLATKIINVTGLKAGEFYTMAVYEYNLGSMCYDTNPTIVDFMTNCRTTPEAVRNLRYTALDNSVAIRWNKQNCFDKYLVVASDQPITGAPSGTSFNSSSSFGSGTTAAGFGPNVYPVLYSNTANNVIVENLTNETTYYFAVYSLNSSQWSGANSFATTPKAACPNHNLERLFINEFHYNNSIVVQDQGVEIAGPAATVLSNYEIIIIDINGQTDPDNFILTHYPLYGRIDDEGAGLGAVWFPMPDMPIIEGGIVLRNKVSGQYVQFLGYNASVGIREAASLSGPIYASTPGVVETDADPAGFSLQRIGSGNCPSDYTWAKLPQTRGMLNAGQTLLPVVLTKLGAEAKGDAARVYWQTTAEENSDYFIIEHSTDGRYFNQIGKVKASGSSQVLVDYQFMDYKPSVGINYYRLKQQDYDGTINDYGIVSVSFDQIGKETLLVFPNPVDKQATITWQGEAETLKLSDANGRLLRTIVLDEYADGGRQSMDMGNLPRGAYYLRLEGRDRIETFTVVKG